MISYANMSKFANVNIWHNPCNEKYNYDCSYKLNASNASLGVENALCILMLSDCATGISVQLNMMELTIFLKRWAMHKKDIKYPFFGNTGFS